jgi:hypothetical protein
MKRNFFVCLVAAFGLALWIGEGAARLPSGTAFAVAAFSQPNSSWQLPAGYLPAKASQAPERSLDRLDAVLKEKLAREGVAVAAGPDRTEGCREVVLSKLNRSQASAIEYWTGVGECAGADYLLVPMVLDWREREGVEFSVRRPARVVMELFLIDVRKSRLMDRFHFEETQKTLAQNLLDIDKFIERGGKWITAMDLAREALDQGVKELGL